MKQFFTLALGLTATCTLADLPWATPAQADDSMPETELGQTEMPVEAVAETSTAGRDAIALNFEPPQATTMPASHRNADSIPPENAPAPSPQAPTEPGDRAGVASGSDSSRKDLFAGGSESIVARTVGAAEGTRSADGGKTDIYEGHVDPGNGVWNRGTFSYQFGNEENLSAEEADRRQVAKIKRIYESVMLPKAEQHGVAPLTLAEELNGIDLINQAPLTVTEDGGYIERLAEAKTKKGLSGQEAILEARIWSFWDASRGGWDAPGLRAYDDMGKEASIRHDQKRRMGMIEDALAAYEQQHGAIAERAPSDQAPAAADPAADPAAKVAIRPMASSPNPSQPEDAEQRADRIIFGSSHLTLGT
ncbi:MAG: hypothetical protein NW224_21450 [Leptolyngbyaceae cyanobacterium bins.302]|nr:hypothetical protein [Leptolyngbyaceae cyanobacterium bins.302]